MKKIFKFSFAALFVMSVISAICGELGLLEGMDTLAAISDFLFPAAGGAMLAVGPGVDVNGQTVEVGDPEGEGKEYLDEVLKKEIVKIRPSDTPLDTLTRELNNTETAHGIEVGGWEVGTRAIDDTVSSQSTAGAIATIPVANVDMWLPGDTLQVPAMAGKDGKPLTLFVLDRGGDGASISVRAINNDGTVPQIAAEAALLRLGTAASEKQAQTEIFAMNPSTRKNYCQIHMAQVEESVIHGLHKKKVDMDFGVYKEQTLWDFKRSMELTNLWGTKGKFVNKKNELVYTSDGLWNQLEQEYNYSATGMTDAEWVRLTRKIFEGNNGADRRLLLAGPAFMEAIASVSSYTKQLEAKSVELVHGIKVHRIETNFGELLIKPMGELFRGAHVGDGMVLDMAYIVKKVFEPLQTQALDLDHTGQRRVKAQRIIENYCLFAENLPAHCKLTPGA
jgi:hypothetical protein